MTRRHDGQYRKIDHSSSYYTHNDIFQDLTFCYLHMTRHDLQIIDTIDTPEWLKHEDLELDIPPHMVPPNPDDSDSAFNLPFFQEFVT